MLYTVSCDDRSVKMLRPLAGGMVLTCLLHFVTISLVNVIITNKRHATSFATWVALPKETEIII